MNTYAIIGGTLTGNRGAEAMVVTTIGRVRDRDAGASFLIMSYMPDGDRALVTDSRVDIIDARPTATLVHAAFGVLCWIAGLVGIRLPDAVLPSSVRRLRRCRALFDVSGIAFHDGRLPVVVYNVLCVWPALLLGVPVVRFSQALGPFRRPLNRLPARWVTAKSVHSFARGRLTADHMRRLGVPDESWSQASDVAFAYRPSDSLTSENDDRVAQLGNRLDRLRAAGTEVVALVPSSVVLEKMAATGADYLALLADLARDLHERGLHILVLPNATRAGVETLRNNDIAVVVRLREVIADNPALRDEGSVSYVDFDLNTAAIRSLIQPCRLVITSRFHAMVAALALGVPTLVMGWSHKYEEVLELFGCADNALDFSRAESELQPAVDRLLAENARIRQRILAALPGVVASAESQFELVDDLPAR